MLCAGFLSDGLSEILLSGGIHGGTAHFRHRFPEKGIGVYHDLPEHGDCHSAAGHQRWGSGFFGDGRGHTVCADGN